MTTETTSDHFRFVKVGMRPGAYKVLLNGHDIGYCWPEGASGRFAAQALVDQHFTKVGGLAWKSGTMEGIRSSYHDGTFKNRAAAAKALAKTFRVKGLRS